MQFWNIVKLPSLNLVSPEIMFSKVTSNANQVS